MCYPRAQSNTANGCAIICLCIYEPTDWCASMLHERVYVCVCEWVFMRMYINTSLSSSLTIGHNIHEWMSADVWCNILTDALTWWLYVQTRPVYSCTRAGPTNIPIQLCCLAQAEIFCIGRTYKPFRLCFCVTQIIVWIDRFWRKSDDKRGKIPDYIELICIGEGTCLISPHRNFIILCWPNVS